MAALVFDKLTLSWCGYFSAAAAPGSYLHKLILSDKNTLTSCLKNQ